MSLQGCMMTSEKEIPVLKERYVMYEVDCELKIHSYVKQYV